MTLSLPWILSQQGEDKMEGGLFLGRLFWGLLGSRFQRWQGKPCGSRLPHRGGNLRIQGSLFAFVNIICFSNFDIRFDISYFITIHMHLLFKAHSLYSGHEST